MFVLINLDKCNILLVILRYKKLHMSDNTNQDIIDPNDDADKLEYLARLGHHVLSTFDADLQAHIYESIPVTYHEYLDKVRSMTECEMTEACVEIHRRYDGVGVSGAV